MTTFAFARRSTSWLLSIALGLAVLLGSPVATQASINHAPLLASARLASGWTYYRAYGSYSTARRAEAYLQHCGYRTCVRCSQGCYYVYYR